MDSRVDDFELLLCESSVLLLSVGFGMILGNVMEGSDIEGREMGPRSRAGL